MNDQERYRDLAERVLGRNAFAAQLTDAGASALGSGGDEVVAWSQWRLATEPWEALLLAFGRGERKELQPGSRRRSATS